MTTTSDQATPSRRRRREEPPGHDKAPGRTRGRPRGKRHGGRAARRRKRGPLRTVLMAVLALAVLGTGGLGWVYLKLNGDIDTFDGEGLSKNRPGSGTSKGANVLVIGSDARTEGNSALGGGSKDDIGRADTAFLLHVYADHKHAIAVSIPRDTLVTIPPCLLPDGTWTEAQSDTMFNAAFSVGQTESGNPACTQNTVEELTGLRVDHTLVVDFKGFAALTDVVGGVRVCLPQDIYQGDLNPNRATKGDLIFEKGEQDVSGQKALDYVRIRHGIGDGSDIGRIKRQQAFVSSLLKKIKSDGLTPTKLLPLATAATQSMTVDPGLGTADKLIAFGMSLKDIDLHDTKFVTVPWRYQGSRVALAEPDASGLWAALKADRTIDGKDASGGARRPRRRRPLPPEPRGPPEAGWTGTVSTWPSTTGPPSRGLPPTPRPPSPATVSRSPAPATPAAGTTAPRSSSTARGSGAGPRQSPSCSPAHNWSPSADPRSTWSWARPTPPVTPRRHPAPVGRPRRPTHPARWRTTPARATTTCARTSRTEPAADGRRTSPPSARAPGGPASPPVRVPRVPSLVPRPCRQEAGGVQPQDRSELRVVHARQCGQAEQRAER